MQEQNNPKEWLPALWYLPTTPWTYQMMVNDMVYPDVDYETKLAQDIKRYKDRLENVRNVLEMIEKCIGPPK